jgi:hypothetical protein
VKNQKKKSNLKNSKSASNGADKDAAGDHDAVTSASDVKSSASDDKAIASIATASVSKATVSVATAVSVKENVSFSKTAVSAAKSASFSKTSKTAASAMAIATETVAIATHPVFGEGMVMDSRLGETELLVKFRSGLTLWLPRDRVKVLSRPVKTLDEISAKRMVEAFRLGIVPHQDVEDFTFGREPEIYQLEQGLKRLKEGTGGAYLVEGDYGSGKTHLLEYILHQALKMGMVTSQVSFDPREVAPNRPKRVYRDIVHNLRYLNHQQEGSFRDLLRRATKLGLKDHCFFTPVLQRLKRIGDADPINEVFWQWIEGESTKEYAVEYSTNRIKGGYRIPALYDFTNASDFYCYILSGLSYIARQLDFAGLVLLVDEAETVTHLWDMIAFSRGMNFLEGLIRTVKNDPELTKIDTRLIHNRVRPTPYIYREPAIVLIIATTPTPYDYTYIKLTHLIENRLTLSTLRSEDLHHAYERLTEIYRHAYPTFSLSEPAKKRIVREALKPEEQGIRFFLKFCVETLDVLRLSATE